jgi:DNA primase catalytic subunit
MSKPRLQMLKPRIALLYVESEAVDRHESQRDSEGLRLQVAAVPAGMAASASTVRRPRERQQRRAQRLRAREDRQGDIVFHRVMFRETGSLAIDRVFKPILANSTNSPRGE